MDIFKLPDWARPVANEVRPRLSGLGLCCTPNMSQWSSRNENRFTHAMGTALLCLGVCARPEFRHLARVLTGAAITHDVGGGPLVHACEGVQLLATGVRHEGNLSHRIENTRLGRVIREAGISPEEVIAFVTGACRPFSDLIAGPCIDTDNIDNVVRYVMQRKLHPFPEILYSPQRLAQSFRLIDNRVVLTADSLDDLNGWVYCRKRAYRYINSKSNIGVQSLYQAALYDAYREGYIGIPYFELTDLEGLAYLRGKTTVTAKALVGKIDESRPHRNTVVMEWRNPTPLLKTYLEEYETRFDLASRIADKFKLNRYDVTAFTGKLADAKKLTVPLYCLERGFVSPSPVDTNTRWSLMVFADPEAVDRKKRQQIADFVGETLAPFARGQGVLEPF